MKRIIKNPILAFILGAIIFGSIGVVSAYTIFANDIRYTPKDNTWKKGNGTDITNVKEAIDELYTKTKTHTNNLQIVKYKANNANGTIINVEIGDYIFVSSNASSYATNSEQLINSLYGGSFNNIGTYTCVYKATATNIKITTDNNCNFSYIVVRR